MNDLKIGKSSGKLYIPKPKDMPALLTTILTVVCLAIAFFFFFGCSDSVSGPYNNGYGLKYDKLFDQPPTPPSRPPFPCGCAIVDTMYVCDVHAENCSK